MQYAAINSKDFFTIINCYWDNLLSTYLSKRISRVHSFLGDKDSLYGFVETEQSLNFTTLNKCTFQTSASEYP